MSRITRSNVRALVAAGAVAAVVGGAIAFADDSSTQAASTSATCDASPAVSDAPGGSQISVTCTVPRVTTTVTQTVTPSPDPTTPSASSSPSDSPSTSTPSATPTQTSVAPTPTPTTPTSTATASTAVLGASLGQPLPAPQTLPVVRYYRAPTWKGSELEAAYNKGTRVFVVSTKDSTPASMVSMVQAAPKDATFYLTSYHEPDDNIKAGTLKVATYCARMNALGQAMAGQSNVKVGPIHNGSYGATAWEADEKGCDRSLFKFWGMDRYSPSYQSPMTQFAEGRDYAKSLGLPLVIAEVGADPANAAAQQTLAAQIHGWALDPANNVAAICWWQQDGYLLANANVQHALLGS